MTIFHLVPVLLITFTGQSLARVAAFECRGEAARKYRTMRTKDFYPFEARPVKSERTNGVFGLAERVLALAVFELAEIIIGILARLFVCIKTFTAQASFQLINS